MTRRLVLPEFGKPRKRVDGPRVKAPGFGGGTILKEGPEVSLVQWDDPAFPNQFVSNSKMRRLT